MDFDPRPFDFGGSLAQWLILLAFLVGGTLVLSLIFSLARNGAAGPGAFMKGLISYLEDLGSLSIRRILAITSLTFKEAVRRKALLVFVVFAVLLMFAGWFISNANDRAELQVNVHITFVLTTIAWLILPAVIFLSCWGIPEDIRLRSLHTVVTKPARRLEIVLGRMIGFGTVTTLLASGQSTVLFRGVVEPAVASGPLFFAGIGQVAVAADVLVSASGTAVLGSNVRLPGFGIEGDVLGSFGNEVFTLSDTQVRALSLDVDPAQWTTRPSVSTS